MAGTLATLLPLARAIVAQNAGSNSSTDGGAGQTQNCPGFLPGFTLQGADCRLLCRPAQWTDVAVFFVGNYVAHAATVISRPGQSTMTSIITIVSALLLPGLGVVNGFETILSLATFGKTSMRKAARAGALAAVVKVPEGKVQYEWERGDDGEAGQSLEAVPAPRLGGHRAADNAGSLPDEPLRPKPETHPLVAPKIHGWCQLPEGYELVIVHRDATFVADEAGVPPPAPRWKFWHREGKTMAPPLPQTTASLSYSYNAIKTIISIVQLIFAISTLYQARGDQLERYGYAAFGLTVSPYLWMSFVNLLGNLLCPQYDCIFVVGSEGLDHLERRLAGAGEQARRRFGVTGVVGRLERSADQYLQAYHLQRRAILRLQDHRTIRLKNRSLAGPKLRRGPGQGRPIWPALPRDLYEKELTSRRWRVYPAYPAALVPVALVGGLSLFRQGQSTLDERVWTMMWLAFGVLGVVGNPPALVLEGRPVIGEGIARGLLLSVFFLGFILVYGVAAIGGLVTVGKMIKKFGVCESL